ncbi:MAG TPA: hypothetical protein V6D25_11210 [Leptolyngbyaceae cyanobacterium]
MGNSELVIALYHYRLPITNYRPPRYSKCLNALDITREVRLTLAVKSLKARID